MSEHDCPEQTYTQAEFDKYADLMEKKVNRLMGKLDCERANAAYWLEQEIDRRSEIIGLARERDRLRAWKINEQATASHDHEFLDKIYAAFASIEAALDSSEVEGYEHDDWVWLDEANRILDLVRAISDEFAND